MMQDSKGFLWLGTKGGVSRFDGKTFQNFTVKDGLADNLVFHFFEHSNGDIFISVRRGFAVFADGKIENIPFPDHQLERLYFVYEDSNANTFFFFNDFQSQTQIYQLIGNRFYPAQDKFSQFRRLLVTDSIPDKFALHRQSNTAWIKAGNRIIEMRDDQAKWIASSRQQIFDLKVMNDTLFYSVAEGIYSYKEGLTQKLDLPLSTSATSSHFRRVFARDRFGRTFYTNTQHRINFFDGNELVTDSRAFYGELNLLMDHEGTLWVGGMDGDGIFSLESTAFLNYLPSSDGMPGQVWSIVEDTDGNLWFGGYREGLVRFDGERFDRVGFPFAMVSEPCIYPGGIRLTGGEALFSIVNNGVIGFRDNMFFKYLDDEFTRGASLILFEDTINERVLSGNGGGELAIRYPDGAIELKTVARPAKSNSIVSISLDEQNRYWLGFFRGMTIYDGDSSWVLPHETCDYNLGAICQYRDKHGTLWTGNEFGLFAIRGNSYRQVGAGYFPSTITSLAPLGNDSLIVGAINGLGIVDIKSFALENVENIAFFDNRNGFHAIEVAQNCITRDSKGRFWIAASDRVVRFDPKEIKPTTTSPHVFIKKLQYLDDVMQWRQPDTGTFCNNQWRLPYYRNNIRLTFGATSLRFPDKVQFMYMLEGNDHSWSLPSQGREAVYTNLKPGNYDLLVKAANFEGVWSENPIKLTIIIHPAFWQTHAFRITVPLLMLLITVFITVYYTNRKRLRLLLESEQKNKMTELRLRSLQNQLNPHFIFNVMNGIAATIVADEPSNAYSLVTRFSKLIRNTLDNANILTRPLEAEIDFVGNYLELEKNRFKNSFNFVIKIDDDVNRQIMVPKMAIQTFAENAVKHGLFRLEKQGQINIAVKRDSGKIIIVVSDNGIGRKKAQELNTTSTGKGLKIMKQFFEVFNSGNTEKITFDIADLNPSDQVNVGTVVKLMIPERMNYDIR